MSILPMWLVYALTALFLYGLWAFFPKMASLHLPAKEALLFQIIGILAVGVTILLNSKSKLQFSLPGLIYSILGGIAGIVGTLFFLKALALGKTYVVIIITALYPLLAILLAFIVLREPLTAKNALGIGFAMVAIYLFAF
jgi:bacterial/archaeal transporter family protein